MRRVWAGVNASDVNFTAGRYFGSIKESESRLPFDAGFEAVGVIAAVGEGVPGELLQKPQSCSMPVARCADSTAHACSEKETVPPQFEP